MISLFPVPSILLSLFNSIVSFFYVKDLFSHCNKPLAEPEAFRSPGNSTYLATKLHGSTLI
jgi:hypothetical protein